MVSVLSNSSAGICAGFWMLDSWHFCKQILDGWSPNVPFGILAASTLASWGTLGRSWDMGATRKVSLRSRVRLFSDVLRIQGTLCIVFYSSETKNHVSCLVSKLFFLMIFEFESGCLGSDKHLALEVLHKSTCAEVGFLMISGSIFHDSGWLWDSFS